MMVSTPPEPVQGPAADYPVVLGAPFAVDGVLYTPADTLNYDEVGYAVAEDSGEQAISGEHRTLPLPSYVEVTSLDTGRTILVRLERRGPMAGGGLIGLSPGALGQLSAADGTPVRVRRINPPEQERAMLRRGEQAPGRMDTPMSLVNVLRRKLPVAHDESVALAPRPEADEIPAEGEQLPVRAPLVLPQVADNPKKDAPLRSKADGNFVVQAGSFAVEANARKVASVIGGTVNRSGKYYRVRTGPFASRDEAKASLAKVLGAGYSGARIYSIE